MFVHHPNNEINLEPIKKKKKKKEEEEEEIAIANVIVPTTNSYITAWIYASHLQYLTAYNKSVQGK